ncbi:tyrosine-type recombinase/integrase [Methyloversatilis sp.]|uniref:tyrosine-type recombinase/integrase n=1 Tax=Methyloversatilis sp. TaxID=2569862 RepID=UPI003524B66D
MRPISATSSCFLRCEGNDFHGIPLSATKRRQTRFPKGLAGFSFSTEFHGIPRSTAPNRGYIWAYIRRHRRHTGPTPLTNLVATNSKPRSDGRQLKLFDSNGLFLLITPAGGKYWRMKYRWAGKEKLLALGVFPEVSLKEARTKRDAARTLLVDHIDPSTKRRSDRLAARFAAESSFKALALEWHRTKASGWAPRHAESVLKTLEIYLFPDLGALPVADIEPMALLEVLRKVERTGKLDTAKRLRERTQAIFRLAIQTGRAKYNPAAELTDALQAAVSQPRVALTLNQLPDFLAALKTIDLTPQTRVLFAVM